jgi:hypothetical protein
MPENYRGADGQWKFPNGELHPHNLTHIYDSDGCLREASPPRANLKRIYGMCYYPNGHPYPRNLYVTDGPATYDDTATAPPPWNETTCNTNPTFITPSPYCPP